MAIWVRFNKRIFAWNRERTGNTPLEAMVIEYCQLKGTDSGMDLRVITEIAEYFENELEYQIRLGHLS